MANQHGANQKGGVRRRCRSYSELENEQPYESDGHELRTSRVQRLESSQSQTQTAAITTMTSESPAALQSVSTSKHERRKDATSSAQGQKHRRRRRSTIKEDGPTDYVYDDPEKRSKHSREYPIESNKPQKVESPSHTEDESGVNRQEAKDSRKRKIRVIYITEEDDRIARRKDRRSKDLVAPEGFKSSEESVRRSRASPSKRRSSVESPPITLSKRSTSTNLSTNPRPRIKRSNTITSHVSANVPLESSLNGTLASTKRASFIGSFFGPAAKQHQEPQKLVECLTCLSDDVPRSKSAKLKCGHRMCHSCLRRIFKLSVTDPQHMPPKCCTADYIPLKHVERLFDINFKKLWNRKFQEYSTKNRIYCPGRRCGEWIRPGNIHKEDGRKYGKCSRCKTKVCCVCNGKWHGIKECPKDEETNRLLATAKDEGWQRCYNCRTMVELKEGCNHMTCRCTAEFCMLCGLKWKTCNCPWFNYDAVEADRLDHMQIPVPVVVGEALPERVPRLRRQRPPDNYRDEVTERRRQERMDEDLARRLQRAAIDDNDDDGYQGGIGDIHGIGNGAGHFMNQDYIRAAHNILTGTFDQATAAANYVMGVAQARGRPPPPPEPRRMTGRYPVAGSPPILRRHSERAHTQNATHGSPSTARIIPRRTTTDYEGEAAERAPLGRNPQPQDNTRPSVLAGLGDRMGGNRVSAWRRHVEPGVTPSEGVLST